MQKQNKTPYDPDIFRHPVPPYPGDYKLAVISGNTLYIVDF